MPVPPRTWPDSSPGEVAVASQTAGSLAARSGPPRRPASARPLAPQVTALPPLAAYHDLRWLFAFNQSWLGFTAVFMLLVLALSLIHI